MSGFNTDRLIDPVNFYNVITKNLDKFSDEDKFMILRFFDKIADSIGFSYLCKNKLKYHIDKKDLKSKAELIFNSDSDESLELLDGIAYLDRVNSKWNFRLKNDIIAYNISNEDALKIVKDINTVFLLMNDINKEG